MSFLSRNSNFISNKTSSVQFVFFLVATLASLGASSPVEVSKAQLLTAPMSFEANQGQTADSVRFLSRGPGYTFFLTPTEAVLSLRSTAAEAPPGSHRLHPPKTI